MFEGAEHIVIGAVNWLRLGVESVGAIVIGSGVVMALVSLLRGAMAHDPATFTRVRLTFARYLALGLEFQLAADILSTAIAPSWDQIGKLAAIAVIRTGLNWFLHRELREHGESAA